MSAKAEILVKAEAVYEALPPDSKRFMKQSQASSWVNVIPLEDEGFNVSKEDQCSDRFIENKLGTAFPSHSYLLAVTCVCSQPNNLTKQE